MNMRMWKVLAGVVLLSTTAICGDAFAQTPEEIDVVAPRWNPYERVTTPGGGAGGAGSGGRFTTRSGEKPDPEQCPEGVSETSSDIAEGKAGSKPTCIPANLKSLCGKTDNSLKDAGNPTGSLNAYAETVSTDGADNKAAAVAYYVKNSGAANRQSVVGTSPIFLNMKFSDGGTEDFQYRNGAVVSEGNLKPGTGVASKCPAK
jgi:hypothetical protein